MKLNEVLDVFGNESMESVMTPEQEFEASVESIIEEIDNVMEIRAGLESMEAGSTEVAKASCESLLTGLVVREMSIANEDQDFAGLMASFGVQPALLGLEAMSKEELKTKLREKGDKLKEKASKAKERIQNSRLGKALAAVKAKIVAWIKSFFTLEGVMNRSIGKLVKWVDKIKASEFTEDLNNLFVKPSRVATHIAQAKYAFKFVYDAAISGRWSGFMNLAETIIADLKTAENEDKMKDISAMEFLNSLSGIKYATLKEAVNYNKINKMVDKLVEEWPELGKKVLKWMGKLISAIKSHFKQAVTADIKTLKTIAKYGKKKSKKKDATESVQVGIESLDALFGEIGRIEYGLENYEVPAEYAEYGVEGAEILEDIDAFEATIAAIEAVEEMYIEATIPSQIHALESIAIEKGLNPDTGVSFELFGNMSAGIEASDEIVENASEETKKTMKDRIKNAGSKVSKTMTPAWTFFANKFNGFRIIPRALAKVQKKVSKMSAEEFATYIAESYSDINAALNALYNVKALSEAKTEDEVANVSPKTFDFTASTTKEELLAVLAEALKDSKSIRVPRATAKDLRASILASGKIENAMLIKRIGSKIGSMVKGGLTAVKNCLSSLVGKFRKKKVEEPEPAAEA